LIRSYLGKAYFEEKRADLANEQFAIAQELDPLDPTAYLYEAIKQQTEGRPGEALENLQKSTELNDNRAVYRSKLLLDSDLAARSASQARIYSDLGFQQLALVEGWKSVNTDPTNYSAHRFLADSYAALPRHEIARVSELLQSQLLQPLSTTPIQPRLAESNLFLVSSGGPGALSFNEFNPLFNRDQLTLQGGGLIGEHDTYSGEGVFSGIYKNMAFSLGAVHYETDGWRTRAFQEDDIANAFLQVEISPQTSFQTEYRYRNTERGDLQQRFFPEDFSTDANISNESHTIRLGLRHAFSPSSTLLTSFIYRHEDFRILDKAPAFGPLLGLRFTDQEQSGIDNFDVALQYLHRSKFFNFTVGFDYVQIVGDENVRAGINAPPPPDGPGPFELDFPALSLDTKQINVYAYLYINLLKNVMFTLGGNFAYVDASEDFIPGGGTDQFNPKFGITWTPFSNTTVRGSVTRTLKKLLTTDQTLEPTQIAGFNQFFDDLVATDAWRYGVAIDQKFSHSLFGGAEFTYRDFDFPSILANPDGSTELSSSGGEETMARAYAFWTPMDRLALRTEYRYERFENALSFDGRFPLKLTTHRVPIGINYIDPSGLSAALAATYWNQDGRFFRITTLEEETGSDQFWTVDMSINYRFPKRHGFTTVGITNLFDQDFNYFEIDSDNPTIQPDRMIFARISLAFP
jgi:tetratricopeptide (TPR) repeat protein